MSDVSVIIPAYNEQERLEQTVRAVRSLPYACEIIVVNDGSTDKTGQIADACADRAVHLAHNQGKGRALQAGWKRGSGTYMLCLDADLQESAGEAERLITPLFKDEADVTISRFKASKKSGFGLVKRRAQRIIYRETGILLQAPLSGQRAFHRRWLDVLMNHSYIGFGVETQMSIDLLKSGARLLEIETSMTHRETGKSIAGFRHRFKQWLEIERNVKGARS